MAVKLVKELSQVLTYNIKEEDLHTWIEAVEYKGFNMPAVWAKMTGGVEENKLADLFWKGAVILMVRGTNISPDTPGFAKTSTAGQDIIRTVFNTLHLKNQKAPAPDTPTWARLGIFTVRQCAIVLATGLGRIVGKVPYGLPMYTCFPNGNVLIEKDKPEQYTLWLVWNYWFDEIINQQERKKKRGVRSQPLETEADVIRRLVSFAAARTPLDQIAAKPQEVINEIKTIAAANLAATHYTFATQEETNRTAALIALHTNSAPVVFAGDEGKVTLNGKPFDENVYTVAAPVEATYPHLNPVKLVPVGH